MKKVFYLKTCDTCKRIMTEVGAFNSDFELQNIKENPISGVELDESAKKVGSYEQLFNKQSKKYKELDLKSKVLTEMDFRNLILGEYTFLKRPVFVFENDIFVGNAKATIEALKIKLKI